MDVLAVIPARYASRRFPGKPLATFDGKPLIQHVWERVRQCRRIDQCFVATDDERIRSAVEGFGGQAVMTKAEHVSGTDRVAEVAEAHPDVRVIVNVQGDEPLIDPVSVDDAVGVLLEDPRADLSTLMAPLGAPDEVLEENVVKVVVDLHGYAMYFSRAPIPHMRSDSTLVSGRKSGPYRHIGLYCYRRDSLLRMASLPPSPLEQVEQLEQLRALENGMRIQVVEVEVAPPGVDTPEDLERVKEWQSSRSSSS